MTPRLEKLLRQRTLLREHLRWIEDEVAAEEGKPASDTKIEPRTLDAAPVGTAPQPTAGGTAAPVLAAGSSNPAPADTAEELLPEPAVHDIHREVRSGCMLYFGLASALVLVVVAIIYFVY